MYCASRTEFHRQAPGAVLRGPRQREPQLVYAQSTY